MKKIKVLAIIAALACLTAGCSDAPKDSSSARKESSSVIESSEEESSEESSEESEESSEESPEESSEESKEVHTKIPDADGNISTDGVEADFGSSEGMEVSVGMAALSYVKAAVESDLEGFCRMMYPTELAEKEAVSEEFAELMEEEPDELTSFTVKSYTKLEDAAVEGANAYYQAMADQYGVDLGMNVPSWGYEVEIQYTTKNEPEPVDGTLTALNFALNWKFLPMDAESAAALKEMNAE
ncbi:MAG TPA: hypothetical protein DCZ62_09835 [Ruminococcus sp.]|nr:hypothetical protein [Ruminococcus sp.]